MKRGRISLIVGSIALGAAAAAVFAFSSVPIPTNSKPATAFAVPFKGTVAKLLVKNGDLVAKGQPLASLDISVYEAELRKDEGELQQLQSAAQNAIQPISGFGGMTGFLPTRLPQTEVIRVPIKVAPPVAIVKKPAPKIQSGFDKAAEKQKDAASQLAKATQDLAKATADLSDAQKARDALRVKATQANAAAAEAARKAAGAPDLLTAGVISRNRAQQLADEDVAAKKNAESMQGEVSAGEATLTEAQKSQQAATEALDKQRAEVALADSELAKANVEPPQTAPLVKPAPAKPVMETRIVTRHMPLMRIEEPQPIPVKVAVDEKAIHGAEDRVPALEKRIAELKALVAANQVLAPIAGRVEISETGEISIRA